MRTREERKELRLQKKEDRRQYFFAIRELTSREIKRKYARSYLGIVWSLLNPLLSMIVMSLIFSTIFKRSIDNFPLYYLTGQTLWGFFSQSTNTAMNALVDNKNLLIKGRLPKYAFVLSRVYTAVVNLGYSLIAYGIMLVVFQANPGWMMLLFPMDLLLLLFFSLGISFVLSILYVFFADIKYLYSIILTLWMQLSAIFYPVTRLPKVMRSILGYNPIYLAINIGRDCMVYANVPNPVDFLKLTIWAFGCFGIGVYVFKKYENNVMQKI